MAMSDLELIALVDAEERQAIGFHAGELADQRAKALKYYLQEPFGNEEEGRSQAISSDVSDVVDWMLPSLIRVFTSSEKAVEFEPVGPDDTEQADQETAAVNHVFYKQNNGFLIFYNWFWDALAQKNGIVKAQWDESEVVTRETYEGLSDVELAALEADPELEAIEAETRTGTVGLPDGSIQEGQVHDVAFKRTKKGRLFIEVIPPEEFLISSDARGLDIEQARFKAHRTQKTRSELIEMGFDRNLVENLPTSEDGIDREEKVARQHLADETEPDEGVDDSQKLVWITEAYVKLDWDQDGVAELRQVIRSGAEILSNEEVDRSPFHALTPTPLPHKFYGLSEADQAMDVQFIKSTILRQTLDNLYLANNPEKIVNLDAVDEDGIDDLLSSRVGGLKRVNTGMQPAQNAVAPLETSFVGEASLAMLGYFDRVIKNRTGVGEEVQGLDPNTLATANTGVVNQAFEAARMQLEQVARIFAETGVKSLFRHIHELLQKHQDKPLIFLLRGEWVQTNPKEWRERTNMTVNVGLGTGNKDQQIIHLNNLMEKQAILRQDPEFGRMVQPRNVFNALSKMVEATGLKEPSLYFTAPESLPPAQPQVDPQTKLLEIQQQVEAQKLQIEQQKLDLDRFKLEIQAEEHLSKDREREQKHLHDMTKLEVESGKDVPGSAV